MLPIQTTRHPLTRTALGAVAAVLALLTASAPAQQATGGKVNLLTNPSFEEGLTGWEFTAAVKRGTATEDKTDKRDGQVSLCLENPAGDDNFVKQSVVVKPKTRYRMTGYIKTKDVAGKGGGAMLSLSGGYENTEHLSGTNSWKKVSFEFDSGAVEKVTVGARLGHYHNKVMGKAWFDDLELVELGPSRKR